MLARSDIETLRNDVVKLARNDIVNAAGNDMVNPARCDAAKFQLQKQKNKVKDVGRDIENYRND